MTDIETKVVEIVADHMGVELADLTLDTHFINDLNADSLDSVELIMEFEDEFDLSIPDEEADKLQTIGKVADYIAERKGEK